MQYLQLLTSKHGLDEYFFEASAVARLLLALVLFYLDMCLVEQAKDIWSNYGKDPISAYLFPGFPIFHVFIILLSM